MILDWRTQQFGDLRAYLGTCKHVDWLTGEDVPYVFYYDTATHLVKRYRINDGDGSFIIDPVTKRIAFIEETRMLRLIQVRPAEGP